VHQVHLSTDFGVLGLTWTAQARLARVDWIAIQPQFPKSNVAQVDSEALPEKCRNLLAQLDGFLRANGPIELDPEKDLSFLGMTAFQQKVYRAALTIPMGETRTYSWIANKIQSPQAARAVGQALRSNPLLIFVPCHRVVGSSHVGGFMGVDDPTQPEMKLKSHLLEVEKKYRCPPFEFLERSESSQSAWG
jgi:O-6-methylguanine DNA methyltransferase